MTTQPAVLKELMQELAERICELTGYGRLHPNDIKPDLLAYGEKMKAEGAKEQREIIKQVLDDAIAEDLTAHMALVKINDALYPGIPATTEEEIAARNPLQGS